MTFHLVLVHHPNVLDNFLGVIIDYHTQPFHILDVGSSQEGNKRGDYCAMANLYIYVISFLDTSLMVIYYSICAEIILVLRTGEAQPYVQATRTTSTGTSGRKVRVGQITEALQIYVRQQ